MDVLPVEIWDEILCLAVQGSKSLHEVLGLSLVCSVWKGLMFRTRQRLLGYRASDRGFCHGAASNGDVMALRWGRGNGCALSFSMYEDAAENGHVDVLNFLYQKGCLPSVMACLRAALGGHLDIVRWVMDRGVTCDASIYLWSIGEDFVHFDIIRWAWEERGIPWDGLVTTKLARYGHLKELKWVHRAGCPWDKMVCMIAAARGYLEVLKWAYSNGCVWDRGVQFMAAFGGHLDVIKWTHENGFLWDKKVYLAAAECGHLDVIKWAKGEGLDGFLDEEICSIALKRRHNDVFLWMINNGGVCDEWTTKWAREMGLL